MQLSENQSFRGGMLNEVKCAVAKIVEFIY